MAIAFIVSAEFPATPIEIYNAWLDSQKHTRMTGSPANVSGEIGGDFSAWGGYITGKNLSLTPGRSIEQSWRTTEFAPSDADSHLVIQLDAIENGTQLTISHSNLPDHGMQYKTGWEDHYFTPMKAYFEGQG